MPELNRERSRVACLRYRWLVLACALGSTATVAAEPRAEDLGLRVAPGFRVSLYADETLANDIFAMTLDAKGRVVVTGPGYIKILHDTKGMSRADQATLFATPPRGGMGLCFDGNDLFFCGDGWLSRYRDSQGRGQADGPPEKLWPLAHSEHGGHAMRKGPDGWWYAIGGNDSVIDRRHVTLPRSPVREPEAGALLRLSPDGRQSEILAHGFRNPYDFDFNEVGDLFTYDSDVEREYFLPWYTPTRMYHIAPGGHHGWRLSGYLRSWSRRGFYADTVDVLWPVGRGSPTGVVCYRHHQFPRHYQGGLFALDWTFGKVYFFALEASGASYRTQPEVFLEAVGTSGFDPTDIAVAPDGSLYICMGGRGTRGAVYRIEYVGRGANTPNRGDPEPSDMEAVLHAPQPLDAWSRARWVPLAHKLGADFFSAVAASEKWDSAARIRAIEICTELFGGLPADSAAQTARASSALVRSRVAWALGRVPVPGTTDLLEKLALDAHPHVRCSALQALAEQEISGNARALRPILVANFSHPDKRVRQAAARLSVLLPNEEWNSLTLDLAKAEPQAALTGVMAKIWRQDPESTRDAIFDVPVQILRSTRMNDQRLQAVRLVMLGLGDYQIHNPPVEIYTGYTTPRSGKISADTRAAILNAVRPLLGVPDVRLQEESARLLAMLEDDDPQTPRRLSAFWTSKSSATQDVHYLIVLARVTGPRDERLRRQTAAVLLGLHRKLAGREQRIKQTWGERLSEVVAGLLERDPGLADELLQHPDFPRPQHVSLALGLPAAARRLAAEQFLQAVRLDADFAWSGPLVDLLAELPADRALPAFRSQWSNLGLREAILLQLVRKPALEDRERILAGLESEQPEVIRACIAALLKLPPEDQAATLAPLLRLLRRLSRESKEDRLWRECLDLLQHHRSTLGFAELPIHRRDAAEVGQWLTAWASKDSRLARALNDTGTDPAYWAALLDKVDWTKGDAQRGEALFRTRACQTCHTGTRALGPDLTGVTNRFSRPDLFTAIIDPSRDVAPAYRTTVIETTGGQIYSGIVAFQSADGIILQTGATTTVRLAAADIASRVPSNRSLMPEGLLKDLKPSDLADLYRYLQSLQPREAAGGGKAGP